MTKLGKVIAFFQTSKQCQEYRGGLAWFLIEHADGSFQLIQAGFADFPEFCVKVNIYIPDDWKGFNDDSEGAFWELARSKGVAL